MDPSVIAAAATALIAPYLAKGGEAFASEVGKGAVGKVGELKDIVKSKFKGDKEAEAILDLAEKDPSKARADSLEKEIAKKMRKDPAFAEKMSAIIAINRSVAAESIISSTISTGDNHKSESNSSEK